MRVSTSLPILGGQGGDSPEVAAESVLEKWTRWADELEERR